jgi:hypothetical protein
MKTHAGVSEKLTVCPKRLYFLSGSDDDMISQPTRIHFFDSQLWTWQHRHYAQLRLRQRRSGRKLLVQRQKRRLPKQPGHREDQASIAIANEVHKSGTRPDAIVIGMLVSSLHAEAWQLLQA